MKSYKRKLLELSIVFSLGAFMLLFMFMTLKSDEKNTALVYGLPEGYRRIDVGRRDITADVSNISRGIIDVIKEDEDVIAIFYSGQTDSIYLFDPSGYYFNKGIKGKYFSREDFLKSDGRAVLLYENSAYSLMEDGSSVYYNGSERSVLGTFTKEHPLYEYITENNAVCDFSFDNEKHGRLYLAKCSDQMVVDVKRAFIDGGWDVYEDSERGTEDYSGVVLPDENHMIPAGMLAVFAFGMLLYLTHSESSKGTSFRRGMVASLLPTVIGCISGCAIGLVITAAHTHKFLWNIFYISLGVCLVIMLVFSATSWIIFGGIAKIRLLRKGNPLLEMLLGKVFVVLLMAAVFLTSSYMQGAAYYMVYSLKTLPFSRPIEGYDLVSFSSSYKEDAGEDFGYTDKICTAAIDAIESGQAFSVFSDGSVAYGSGISMNIALGPVMEINGLEKPKDRCALYPGVIMDFNAGDTVEIVNQLDQNTSAFTATVQPSLPDEVTLRISAEKYGYNYGAGAFITMSVKDYKNSHSDMHYVPMGLCFINPTGEQLKEYMNLLVEEGFNVSAQRWNGKAEGDSMTDFAYVLARCIVALSIALEVLLWTVEEVSMLLKTKKEEYRVIELYGGNPGATVKSIFLLSSIIVLPGVLASSCVLPLQGWRYLGLEFVEVSLFYTPVPKVFLVVLAAGIVFTLAVVLGVKGQFSTNSRKHQLWW